MKDLSPLLTRPPPFQNLSLSREEPSGNYSSFPVDFGREHVADSSFSSLIRADSHRSLDWPRMPGWPRTAVRSQLFSCLSTVGVGMGDAQFYVCLGTSLFILSSPCPFPVTCRHLSPAECRSLVP